MPPHIANTWIAIGSVVGTASRRSTSQPPMMADTSTCATGPRARRSAPQRIAKTRTIWPRTPAVGAPAPAVPGAVSGAAAAPAGHGNARRERRVARPARTPAARRAEAAAAAGSGIPGQRGRLVVAAPGEDHLEADGDQDQRQEVDQVEAEDVEVAQQEGGADRAATPARSPTRGSRAPGRCRRCRPASGSAARTASPSPDSTNPRLSRVRTTPRSASDTPMAVCGVTSTVRGGVIVNILLPALRATPPADGPPPGPPRGPP